MATEVELKAWVDDMESLRSRVAARYPHGGSYIKEDVYYRLGGASPGAGRPSVEKGHGGPEAVEFRLRIEGERSYVTAKRKSVVDGVEVNDEIEYAVSSPAAFKRFAEYLGAVEFARKRKRGDRYRAGEATIELSHVDRLGDFIEIERIVEGGGRDRPSGGRIEAADREVRALLDELDIPASKIEPRYYIDMLAALER